ncbi:MAG: heavy metal translocating P-type ATPase [Candidatus Faecivicinus sp.]
MSKKQKMMLARIVAGAVLFVAAILIPAEGWMKLVLFLVPYLVVGWKVLKKAAINIAHGQVFDENFLMCIATIGAFASGEYMEGVAVMLFYQVGELFENYAVGRSRKSISELMDIRPDVANVERDGAIEEVDPEEVAVGDVIVVQPGERVPLDGTVIEGCSMLDTAALTGESVPRSVRTGDSVISGCINQSGVLRIHVEKEFGESTVSKILELVENSSSRKAEAEKFITKFARYYTPAVCFAAVALAVVPSLITGDWLMWVKRALLFLVVSCPCALVISIPLSFFGGIGGASRQGVLIKGANFLETLAKVDTVVFDKTGTLTEGTFKVTAVHPEKMSEAELLELAALVESYSTHPISRSIIDAYGRDPERHRVAEVEEIAGHGVKATVDGHRVVAAGNSRLMESLGAKWTPCERTGTIIHIAVDGEYEGHIVISDIVKPDAAEAIQALRGLGVRRTVMLTGDSEAVGKRVAEELGLDEAFCGLLPADKVEHVEQLLKESKGALAFVGDGINDAPVLSRADIGIAMGALGSDAAIEAADVVLMNDRPSSISTAISISRRTHRIVKQNIVFALGVKAIVLVLSALGLANMWAAVFADVGVSVLAILNAMRALRFRD